MKTLTVKLLDRDYPLSCGEGQEVRLTHIAREIDERLHQLRSATSAPDMTVMALLLMMLTDERDDALSDIERLKMATSQLLDKPNERVDLAIAHQLDHQISGVIEGIAQQVESLVAELKKA